MSSTWDGYDQYELELTKLQGMSKYALKEYFSHQDFLAAEQSITNIKDELGRLSDAEILLTGLAKRHLKLYDETSEESEWQAAEDCLQLAKWYKEEKQTLRSSLPDKVDAVRKARVEWDKAKKMLKTQEQLNS